MKKFRRKSTKFISIVRLLILQLLIKPEKAQTVFIAEGLREIGSGLAISGIL